MATDIEVWRPEPAAERRRTRRRDPQRFVKGWSLEDTKMTTTDANARLPAMYQSREDVEAGGLMSYGPSFSELSRRSAWYVHRILQGAKPAELPIEQPMKFEMTINLKTAKALGLTIPPALLARADEVIQ